MFTHEEQCRECFERFFGIFGCLVGRNVASDKQELSERFKHFHWPEDTQQALFMARDFTGALLYLGGRWSLEQIKRYLPVRFLTDEVVRRMLFAEIQREGTGIARVREEFFHGLDFLRCLLITGLEQEYISIQQVIQTLQGIETETGFDPYLGVSGLTSLHRYQSLLARYPEFRRHLLARLSFRTANDGYLYADILPALVLYEDAQVFLAEYLPKLAMNERDRELRKELLSRLEEVKGISWLPAFHLVIKTIAAQSQDKRERKSALHILRGPMPTLDFLDEAG
jgi:hypothetical protein